MKKGFTLIELLGVFTIMTVIMLVSVPIVTGMMKTAEEQKYESFKNNVFLSAEAYINDHIDDYPDMKVISGYDYVSFSQLIENDYLNSTVYDPKTGLNVDEELEYTVVATVQDNYTYKYTLSTVKLVKDIINPVIANLSVSENIASFTITDNYELQGYAITTSTDVPTVWNNTGAVITYSNTYQALTAGTYYLHVIDYSGNTVYASFPIAATAFCTYVTGTYWDFAYTGAEQTFNVPCNGTYTLEVYGAQGGIAGYRDGSLCASYEYTPNADSVLGSYNKATFNYNKNASLSVTVGGRGGPGYQGLNYCVTVVGTGGYSDGGSGPNAGGGGGGGSSKIVLATVSQIQASGGRGAYYPSAGVGAAGIGGGTNYINTTVSEYNSSYATTTTSAVKSGNGSVRITLVSIN